MEYFPSTLTEAESNAMAKRCEALIAERGWGLWALETIPDGVFIGYTGLHVPEVNFPFSPCVEIGWRLACAAWGKGYATEAAWAALAYGFVTLGLAEIVSFTATGNIRSRAVMERLGMRFSGYFDHPSVQEGHPLRSHVLYTLEQRAHMSPDQAFQG